MVDFSGIGLQIFNWYDENKRDLPWRKSQDPYKIWVSEIILQQTRVIQGIDYYKRIIESFPTVFDMAHAESDEIMKLWQGLGYYSRARNMHHAAKQIAFELNGKFPDSFLKLCTLKGVGRYTAAAIASIAFSEKVPVVDGNVYRLLSRYFGIYTQIATNKAYDEFFEYAFKLMSTYDPGSINQGMMELGAIVCLPQNPDCNNCPISLNCYARMQNCIEKLPVNGKHVKIRNRYFNYLVLENNSKILVRKREGNDVWEGLYDFPLIETAKEVDFDELFNLSEINQVGLLEKKYFISVSKTYFHKLTHQNINAKFFRFKMAQLPQIKNYKITNFNDFSRIAVPRLIDKYLKHEFDFMK